jgi:fused signal recognition particle receptor
MGTGVGKNPQGYFRRIATLFGASEITPDTWEELEAILVQADMGIETARKSLLA